MSKKLLLNLCGNKGERLKNLLNSIDGEPRIAWYPSAGDDFRPLFYLNNNFMEQCPASAPEPKPPQIFLYTDYYPWSNYKEFVRFETMYSDKKTKVSCIYKEQLPDLGLHLHDKIVHFTKRNSVTDSSYNLEICLESPRCGRIIYPVIYAFAENEAFYAEKMVPCNTQLSHIIHIRYGGGTGGGSASGVWITNVLKKLGCEMFITDSHGDWQRGDDYAANIYSSIPKECNVKLQPIRHLDSEKWSKHGDITWNLVQ